jgi:hypothetical protein
MDDLGEDASGSFQDALERVADLLAKLAANRRVDLTDGPKITKHTFFTIMEKQLDWLDSPN